MELLVILPKEISKTALGAEEIVEWEYNEDATEVIKDLKQKRKNGCRTFKDSQIYHGYYDFPVCFVFGHEVLNFG